MGNLRLTRALTVLSVADLLGRALVFTGLGAAEVAYSAWYLEVHPNPSSTDIGSLIILSAVEILLAFLWSAMNALRNKSSTRSILVGWLLVACSSSLFPDLFNPTDEGAFSQLILDLAYFLPLQAIFILGAALAGSMVINALNLCGVADPRRPPTI